MINGVQEAYGARYAAKAGVSGRTASAGATRDTVDIGSVRASAGLYTRAGRKADAAAMERIREETEKAAAQIRALVEKLLAGQSGQAAAAGAWSVDPETAEAARHAVSEDGEWGVKAVSDRIVGFAIALSGNDKSKLAQFKAAIDKGFAEAEKAFGGRLPGICMQTYDAIMQKLDAWAAE